MRGVRIYILFRYLAFFLMGGLVRARVFTWSWLSIFIIQVPILTQYIVMGGFFYFSLKCYAIRERVRKRVWSGLMARSGLATVAHVSMPTSIYVFRL